MKTDAKTQSITCAIILNWNGWQDTLECLHSLLHSDTHPNTIVVVDNGSTDESVKHIHSWSKKHFSNIPILKSSKAQREEQLSTLPPFIIIKSPNNSGYAGGNNIGISWAISQRSIDFIWILNNDVIVKHDALSKLLGFAARTDAGIIGSTVTEMNNSDVLQCAGGCNYNPVTTVFSPFLAGKKTNEIHQFEPPVRLDYIYGAALFVRENIFVACGLFSEEYCLFYEEMDFCRRAMAKGYKLAWCKESLVRHKISQSVGRPDSGNKEKIAFANYHENLSTLLFTKKFYPLLLPIAMLFRFFGKLLMLSKRKEWFLIFPLFDAFRDFIMGRNQRQSYKLKKGEN